MKQDKWPVLNPGTAPWRPLTADITARKLKNSLIGRGLGGITK